MRDLIKLTQWFIIIGQTERKDDNEEKAQCPARIETSTSRSQDESCTAVLQLWPNWLSKIFNYDVLGKWCGARGKDQSHVLITWVWIHCTLGFLSSKYFWSFLEVSGDCPIFQLMSPWTNGFQLGAVIRRLDVWISTRALISPLLFLSSISLFYSCVLFKLVLQGGATLLIFFHKIYLVLQLTHQGSLKISIWGSSQFPNP